MTVKELKKALSALPNNHIVDVCRIGIINPKTQTIQAITFENFAVEGGEEKTETANPIGFKAD